MQPSLENISETVGRSYSVVILNKQTDISLPIYLIAVADWSPIYLQVYTAIWEFFQGLGKKIKAFKMSLIL
jgi:hypothetical protein